MSNLKQAILIQEEGTLIKKIVLQYYALGKPIRHFLN